MQPISYDVNRENNLENSQAKPALVNKSNKRTKENSAILNQCSLDMEVFSIGDVNRQKVELFIKKGFFKAYDADISVNAPWVLAIQNGKFKAALGIRSAVEPLFIEQYLDTPIENVISNISCNVSRGEIAEIGNLYSNAKRFTLPLFLVAAVSLFCNDYRYMVFSGTGHVLKLIKNIGVESTFIVNADENKLTPSNDDWGTYYESQPKVVSISLASVMNFIESNEQYSAMFTALTPKIIQTTASLQGVI